MSLSAIIQLIEGILGAIPALITAITKIIGAIKGQPLSVQLAAIDKGVKAMKDHCDSQPKRK